MWLYNRREDPGTPEADDAVVPRLARYAMIGAGIAFAGFSLGGFLFPGFLVAIWVWPLTPLAARALAGWFALLAVGGIVIGRETRWSAWKVGLTSIFIWHALVLAGAFFNPADFGEAGPFNWYTILVFLALSGMAWLYAAMEKRAKTP